MTRIDFYVLAADAEIEAARYACRIAAKAWKAGHRIHVHADDEPAAGKLDDLLWTFRDTAFLPHVLAHQATAPASGSGEEEIRLTVGFGDNVPATHDVLINLGESVPVFFSGFERVVEVVPPNDAARALSRQRYQFYKERGYPLTRHEITNLNDD